MSNTIRDRTEEHLDRDNLGDQTVPPPQKPVADDSAHVPGGATELGELERSLQPPTGGKTATNQASPTP